MVNLDKDKKKVGKTGKDLIILVPCGTIVYDENTGEPLIDLVEPGDQVVAAREAGEAEEYAFCNLYEKGSKIRRKRR